MVSNYISTWKGKHNALILPNKTGTGELLTILALLCSTSSLGSRHSSNTNLCNFIIVKYEQPITLAWQQDNKAVHIISLTVPFKMRCCWLWFFVHWIWVDLNWRNTVLDERRKPATSHTSEVGPWLACLAVNHRTPQRGLWLEQHSECFCLTPSLTMGPVSLSQSSLPRNKMGGGAETGLRG